MTKPRVGFIGLSHLGICSLLSVASKNFKVCGLDDDLNKINLLKKRITNIEEKNLDEYLKKYFQNITFTTNYNNLSNCNIVYLSQDINTDNFGNSNLIKVTKYINKAIKFLDKDALLVIMCQVPPGFTKKIKWPRNQLFYQVETLIFGQAIKRASFPERIIIGTNSSKLSKKSNLSILLNSFKCPIIPMTYESAELCKISINMFLISNITTANILSEICEKIGANWNQILPALRLDKRIGRYSYINTGLGLSGGNLERDLVSLYKLVSKKSSSSRVINSFIHSSKDNKRWAINKFKILSNSLPKHSKIGLLGISYKENTNSIKNSPSLDILKYNHFKNIYCYDPMVDLSKIKYNFKKANNYISVIKKCDLLIIMTQWKEFKNINKEMLTKYMKGNIIIDPFGVLHRLNLNKVGFRYFSKGESIFNEK